MPIIVQKVSSDEQRWHIFYLAQQNFHFCRW